MSLGEGTWPMGKRVSIKPDWFASDKERWYWHEAQDIAWRMGAEMLLRENVVWLVDDSGERLLCDPVDPDRIWFQAWRALKAEYPEHARTWVKGRPITNPGE